MTLPVIYPMGANTLKPDKLQPLWTDQIWIAERKYDGSRYLIRKENGTVRVVSRQASEKTGLPVDKTDRVPHLVEWVNECNLPEGTILDGEIITHENCESTDVTSIMGSSPEEALRKQEERGFVQYVMFDVIFYNGKDVTDARYIDRRKALEQIHKHYFGGNKYFKIAPVYLVENKEQVYEEIVRGGGEGVILKHAHAQYEYSTEAGKDKRPKNTWVKVKKYDTYDVVIMGFTEPTKEYSGKELETWSYWERPDGVLYYRQNEVTELLLEKGYTPVTKPYFYEWCGAVRFGQYKDGELVEIGQTSGIVDDIKQAFAVDPEGYVGKVLEVGAMRQNKKTGALVHPRFLRLREDKAAIQCVLGKE